MDALRVAVVQACGYTAGYSTTILTIIALRRYHHVIAMDCRDCVTADRESLAPAAALFHSLADPVRLTIVQRLAQGEARVVDLTEQLGLAQSTVSKHLACLRDCQLVDYRAEGRQSFYYVSRPELLDLLRSAEGLLSATGEAIALCPVYGVEAMPEKPAHDG